MNKNAPLENILVIDDDESFCRLLSKLIASEGYQASWTTDPSNVLDLLGKLRPSCVFLDLKLAGLDGMVVLKRIQKFDKRLPVVILTGYESIETAVHAIQQGAFYYMPKTSLQRRELKKIIQKAIKHYQMHQKIPVLKQHLSEVENLEDFMKFSEKLQEMVRLDLLGARTEADPAKPLESSAPVSPTESLELPVDLSLKEVVRRTIEHIEKKWIVNSLNRSRWQQGKAAKLLGIDTKTLYNKMKAYGIEKE